MQEAYWGNAFKDNTCEGEAAVGLEKLNCHAVTTKVPASPCGSSGAGVALQCCPELRSVGLYASILTSHWVQADTEKGVQCDNNCLIASLSGEEGKALICSIC